MLIVYRPKLTNMISKIWYSAVGICFLLFLCMACEADYTPKQRAYPRVVLPEQHSYQTYHYAPCPFTFDYPTYAQIRRDTVFFDKPTENPCWFDILYPSLNAVINVSYKEVGKNSNSLVKLVEDAHKMNSKHIIKADYMEDSLLRNPQGVEGIFYTVGGNAASPIQLVLTDSVQHFIWASVYFNNEPNADSIAPVLDFMRQDVDQFVRSFRWK